MYSGNTRRSRQVNAARARAITTALASLLGSSTNFLQRRFETMRAPPMNMAIGKADHAATPSCKPPNRRASPNAAGSPSGLPGAAYLRQTRNQLTSRPAARVVGTPLNSVLSGDSPVRTLKRASRKVAVSTQNADAARTSA
jgi:hypothetical protein